MSTAPFLSNAIVELFAEVSVTHQLTQADYNKLMSLESANSEPEASRLIQRLLYAVRRGRVQVVQGWNIAV